MQSDAPAADADSFPLDPERIRQLRIYWPKTYEWPRARYFVQDIATGMRKYVSVEEADIPQPFKGILVFRAGENGQIRDIAIDYSDYADCVDISCLDRVSLYFKMQYKSGGYDLGGNLTSKIFPGGYINGNSSLYKYIRHIRAEKENGNPNIDVLGRFSLEFAADFRSKALGVLTGQSHFRLVGGAQMVRYSRRLQEIANSKICIDLPGNGDFCFRLIDYLSVGSCVIGMKPGNRLHVPLVDREHIVYAKDDLSDIVSLCRYYLEHDDERNGIIKRSREFFDRYLHRDQLVAYYLKVIQD